MVVLYGCVIFSWDLGLDAHRPLVVNGFLVPIRLLRQRTDSELILR